MRGRRWHAALCATAVGTALATLPSLTTAVTAAAQPLFGGGVVVSARASEPVVITGAQIPTWSRLSATGQPAPYPSGVSSQYSYNGIGGDNVRSAHNGTITVPPDTRTGVDPNLITAYRWNGTGWTEIPVQVDQMFPYFLANGHSSFSVYSGTDQELSYAWGDPPEAGVTPHSIGAESWKQVFGGIEANPVGYSDPTPCLSRYQQPGPGGAVELAHAEKLGIVSQPDYPGIAPDDYTKAMMDPVDSIGAKPQLDDDDEIAMMAGDAGQFAPQGTPQPAGTQAGNGQQITVVDPTSAVDGSARLSYIYLFLQPGGSHFNYTNGYVHLQWDDGAVNGIGAETGSAPNAAEWIDRDAFSASSPEILGESNVSYGPNLAGLVCRTAPGNLDHITTADGTPRPSTNGSTGDRQPRDGMTITTPTYTVYASGRWMVRDASITALGTTAAYGPNLISRWKGRAFQSSPDSSVSVVGFEDEQTNWEMNSTLLGWKVGPVRAIREIWGADSGTNVTKTEFYYRDSYDYSYHVRVHPIPTDGLYTSWDFRYGEVTRYYNQRQTQGVPIDGTNSHAVGEIDQVPVSGQSAYVNVCDPTYDICSAILNPEEVSGPHGSMVFVADLTGPSTAVSPAVVPFYRDDACFDDGTGDAPVPRPYPGDSSTSSNVRQGYVSYWQQKTGDTSLTYGDLHCTAPAPGSSAYQNPNAPSASQLAFQAAIGEMGLHYFFSGDTDNAFVGTCVQGEAIGPGGVPVKSLCIDEIDAEQWVYPVPTAKPENLISVDPQVTPPGDDYGLDVQAPLQLVVVPYSARTPAPVTPEVPDAALLVVIAGIIVVPLLFVRGRRRRRNAA